LRPLRSILEDLLAGRGMGFREAYEAALAMLTGRLDDVGIAALLVALRAKGEDGDEVAGFAEALRSTCVRVRYGGRLLDTAGTGGDGAHTINASTAAALAAAALGARVAKHGNRSVSSRSGSADFMEAIGYRVEHGAGVAECMLRSVGFTFLYAPLYHPAVKRVMPVRRRLGIRTIFNLVGPLANPAHASTQLLGVASPRLVDVMVSAAARLGYERLVVVHGSPGIDEVSVAGETRVVVLEGGSLDEYTVGPEDLGVGRHPLSELRVASAAESAERVMRVFSGAGRRPDRDFIAANTGFALYAYGAVGDPRDGVEAFLQAAGEGVLASFVERVLEAERRCLSSSSAG